MELQEKCRKRLELEDDKHLIRSQIKALRERLSLRATTYDKEAVQGGVHGNTQEDVILKICDMERDVDMIQKEIDAITESIDKAIEIAKEYGDVIPEIIKAKIESNAPNWAIAKELGIGEATLYRKLKLIRGNDRTMIEDTPKIEI